MTKHNNNTYVNIKNTCDMYEEKMKNMCEMYEEKIKNICNIYDKKIMDILIHMIEK